MKQSKPSEASEQEPIDNAKNTKSNSITNALLIGFLIGILIYSILVNSIGFLSLIPLFLIFKLINK